MKSNPDLRRNLLIMFFSGSRLSINFVGFLGIILIVYEIIAFNFKSRWPLVDKYAIYISTIATLLGTIATAFSVYFYSNGKISPPEKISIFFTAPLVILACIIAIIFFIVNGSIQVNITNGFALLAIAGALNRIIPNPAIDKRLFWKNNKNTSSRKTKTL